jgi:hypothetical protein
LKIYHLATLVTRWVCEKVAQPSSYPI